MSAICDDCGKPFDNGGEPFMLTCDECLRAEGARLAEEAANFRNPTPPPIPVRGGYYLTECGYCGWIGSSEQCLPSEEDVVCPVCCSGGCEDEPSEKDTEAHGEAVMQRILASEEQSARLARESLIVAAKLTAACEALKPFADYAERIATAHPGWDHDQFEIGLSVGACTLTFKPFRRARAVIAEPSEGGGGSAA
ncbi:hypothetical protein [Methylobacterium brachiatum]|uniref:hypothetical protein n=1 Tax=Methylobacterium brachiatum TaxID=269660 RepID=UPI000EFC0D70|nr:hypothetical protein [Methylobacterium brachiatum]AYO85380.1 hypothetical protein EBB05_26250 [Methylobacterium brachiatum]